MNNQKDVLGKLITEDSELKLKIKKLSEDAIVPTRGTADSAGLDLYATEDLTIYPQEAEMVHTGIAMEIPKGYVGLIFARSGLASKHHLRPSNCVGVVDSDYRGEVMVSLYNDNANHSCCKDTQETEDNSNRYVKHIEKGERVAQMVLVPYIAPKTVEAEILSDTERAEGGFGSTGTK